MHYVFHHRMLVAILVLAAAIASLLPLPAMADEPAQVQAEPSDLAGLSLEDLMNITVTSASKKPEKLWQTASAIYVISAEDIRRTGATSLPEALGACRAWK